MSAAAEDQALASVLAGSRNIRQASASAQLRELDKYQALMRDADRTDIAEGIWLELIDGRRAADITEHDHYEVAGQASILARVAMYVPEARAIEFAREAWGNRSILAHAGEGTHLAWYPDDDSMIITNAAGQNVTVFSGRAGVNA